MKDLVESNVQSIWMDCRHSPVHEQLNSLRKESQEIVTDFDQFRDNTLCYVNQVMGKIASTMHREVANKHKLEEELHAVKASNASMKNEVMQLREMIEEFVKGYNIEIEIKNNEI